jgi:hypothetical protein
MILMTTEGYYFLLGKECFKQKNFEPNKVYLPSISKFKLGGTTHFEIIATNCDREGFEDLPRIKNEDVPKLRKKLKDENNNQIFIDDFKIIFIDDSIDLSNLF